MKKDTGHLRLPVIIFAVLGICLIPDQAYTQNKKDLIIRIDQVIDTDYPHVEAFVSVTDKNEDPVLSLVKGNFAVKADGKETGSDLDVEGFLYTDEGVDFYLVISASGLMIDEPVNEQKKAVVAFSELLREQDQISVYMFGEEVKPVFEGSNKNDKLAKAISDAELVGGSPKLWDALRQVAMAMKEPAKENKKSFRRKVMIFISDGRETDSLYTKEQVYDYLGQNKITVYTVGFEFINIENLSKLEEIATQTGGAYLYAKNVKSISDKLKTAYEQITKGYLLKFQVGGIAGDDDFHQLQIAANYKSSEATGFKNFYAKKGRIELWVIILVSVLIVLVLAAVIVLGILYFFRERKLQQKRAGTSQQKKCENPKCGQIKKDEWNECLFCKYSANKKA